MIEIEKGYTGRAEVDGIFVPCTSFSVSMPMVLIKSSSVRKPIFSNGSFTALTRSSIRDFSAYEISLSMDATERILQWMSERVCFSPRKGVNIHYVDSAYGIRYEFMSSDTFVTSLSLSVSEGGIVSVSLSAVVFAGAINIDFDHHDSNRGRSHRPSWRGGNSIVPYWKMSAFYSEIPKEPVISIGFNWQQSVEPMYSCSHILSEFPAFPKKLRFGIPTASFSVSYLHMKDISRKMDYGNSPSTGRFSVKCGDIRLFVCQDCIISSVSPSLANSSDSVSYEVNGEVLGSIVRN